MHAKRTLPELSRFELQCLSRLWELGEATVREIHTGLGGAPSYSTVRKIVERLEEKGAVERVRQSGSAWVYRSGVPRTDMVRKEIKRLLDALFGGAGAPLVSHLADMQAVTLDDLKAAEAQLDDEDERADDPSPGGRS